MKSLTKIFFILNIFFVSSLYAQAISKLPSWYISPKQNNSEYIYGISEGRTLEEATKSALAEMASRLMVTISSQSTLNREEDNNIASEEMRQKITQNIENIDFANFEVSKSTEIDSRFYVEVKVDRNDFIRLQKEKIEFLKNQINNINLGLNDQNIVQKRSSLKKVLELAKQLEIIVRIADFDSLKSTLKIISDANNSLSKMNNKIEFYFIFNSEQQIKNVVRSSLNKESISISSIERNSENQIKIKISSSKNMKQIYGAFITKLKIDFENTSNGKTIASNSIEYSGSSMISEEESLNAAISSFKNDVDNKGILNIIGITQ